MLLNPTFKAARDSARSFLSILKTCLAHPFQGVTSATAPVTTLPGHSLCVVASGEENVLVPAPGPGPTSASPALVLTVPQAGWPPSVQWTPTYLQGPAQTPHCNHHPSPHSINCSLRLLVRIWKVLLLPCLPCDVTGLIFTSWEFIQVKQVPDSCWPLEPGVRGPAGAG